METGVAKTCYTCGVAAAADGFIESPCPCDTCKNYSNWVDIPVASDDQKAKADADKLDLTLVPLQIIEDIAEVRMYGNKKYGDPDNWKTVDKERYVKALLRHTLAYLRDRKSDDKESRIRHYKHMACNMAFICEMEAWEDLENG